MVKISANRLDMETKRLERPQMKNYTETLVTPSVAATTTIDVSLGNVFLISQNVSITTLTISNVPTSGTICSITLIRVHDATTTTYSITWPTSFKWVGGTAPTLTQTVGAVDIINAMTKDGGATWYAAAAGLDMR
jgi:hypothetical protein